MLRGQKVWVLNGHAADRIVVVARSSGSQRDAQGLSLFVVDGSAPGLSRTTVAGMDGQRSAILDLDGVELKDKNGRVVCILRWRTVQGLVMRLPESVDVLVPWELLEDARVDLAGGSVRVAFASHAREKLPWLQSWRSLEGEWTDRQKLSGPPGA